MKKRSLVILMAFLMLFQSMAIFSANAEDEPEIIYLTGEQAMAESRADLVRVGLLECMFSDTKGHWAKDIIDELAMAGVINGREEDIFDPDGTVTNAEFLKLLTCSVEEYNDWAYFEEGMIGDVSSSDWYYRYVASALDAGIIYAGENDSYFLPNENIKRGETAIWISRALGIEAVEDCQFTDVYDEEVKKAVAAGYSQGIITGYDAYTYGPDNTLTRAEAAALVQRVMRSYKELNTTREATNTLEYSENVIEVKDDGKNEIVSADENTGELVLENCTDNVKNVEVGEILYIESSDEFPDGGVVKVDAVEKTGSGVSIKTSAPTVEEVFDEIDISDTIEISPDDFIPNSGDEGVVMVTPERVADFNQRNVFLSNDEEFALKSLSEEDVSDMLVFEIDGEIGIEGTEEIVKPGQVNYKSGGASIVVNITPKLKSDMRLVTDANGNKSLDLTFIVESTVESGLACKATRGVEKKWTLKEFKKRLGNTPLMIEGEITLKVTVEGEFEVSATVTTTNQFGVMVKNNNKTLVNKTTLDKGELSAKATGKIEVGPCVEASLGVNFLFGSFDLVDLEVYGGTGVKGETEISAIADNTHGAGTHNTIPNKEGDIHTCDLCVDGTFYGFISGEAGLSKDLLKLLGIEEVKDKKDNEKKDGDKSFELSLFAKLTAGHEWEWGKWYYSVSSRTGNKFGWGKCPYLFKKLVFTKQPEIAYNVDAGDPLSISIKAGAGESGATPDIHPIGYQWYRDGVRLTEQTSPNLNIETAIPADSGEYHCVVYYQELGEDILSTISLDGDVIVKESDIYFTVSPRGYHKNPEKKSLTFHAQAVTNLGEIRYQWYRNGQAIEGKTGQYYKIELHDGESPVVGSGGTYYCVATAVDSNGNILGQKESGRAMVYISNPNWPMHIPKEKGVLVPYRYCGYDGIVRWGEYYAKWVKSKETDDGTVTYQLFTNFRD